MPKYLTLAIFLAVCSTMHAKVEFFDKNASINLIGDNAQIIISTPLDNFSGKISTQECTHASPIELLNDGVLNMQKGTIKSASGKIKGSGCIQSTNQTMRSATQESNSQQLVLNQAQQLELNDASVNTPILIKGNSAAIRGKGWFVYPIDLENSNAHLKLSITGKLDNNINLNGGTITLENDLAFKDNMFFTGSGTVNINAYSLIIPAKSNLPTDMDISFINARDIQLNGYTTLSSNWTFENDPVEVANNPNYTSSSVLNGNGNVLDMTSGCINVGANHTLYITNTYIKGLGGSSGTLNMTSSSTIALSQSSFELHDNLIINAGTIAVISPNCKLIVTSKKKLVLYGPSSRLQINGVSFFYEATMSAPVFPPPFAPLGGTIELLNGGEIRNVDFDNSIGVHEFDLASSVMGINYITKNITVTPLTVVKAINENPAQPKNIIIDSTGHILDFTVMSPNNVIAQENLSVLVQNTFMKNFDYEKVDLQGSGMTKASCLFGQGVLMTPPGDISITNHPLQFVGNAIFDAKGTTVTLNSDKAISITNDSSLVIRNGKFKIEHPSALKCLTANSKIVLQNCELLIGPQGFELDSGYLDIVDDVKLTNSTNISGCCFRFLSPKQLTIQAQSMLKINSDLKFIFNPDISQDNNDPAVLKSHLIFSANSSALSLRNCSMELGLAGLKLAQGKMIINGVVDLLFQDPLNSDFDIEEAGDLMIMPDATISCNGKINHN